MSLYYSIGISVRDANPERALDIKEAAEAEWPFDVDDWQPCDHPDDLTAFEASATGNLCAVLTEQELAHRLIRAIWEANGGYCEVEVSATHLEDMPYETYRLDREDFERMIGKAAEAVEGTTGNRGESNQQRSNEPEPYPVTKQFQCPKCGERRLEEIESGVVFASEICDVPQDGNIRYADHPLPLDSDGTDRYQCLTCGWVLPCDADSVALAEYLADPERACNPDLPQPQENHHG